jgi:hypothetical protein
LFTPEAKYMQDTLVPQESNLNGQEMTTAVSPPPPPSPADETPIPITDETDFPDSDDDEFSSETTPMTREETFDALNSLTRLLVGGAIEGSAELAERLKAWETYLREEGEISGSQTIDGHTDLARYALIGFIFESQDKARRGLSLVWGAQKRMAKTAVSTARPLTNNRLLQPLQRRLDRAAQRGQDELVRWIQRGQAEESFSRQLANLAYAEIMAEFISQLAENQEVQELVQQQGVGLAGEVVDQVRERTFTADTVVERLARALTRRPPRLTPPPADLSELPGGPLVSGTK